MLFKPYSRFLKYIRCILIGVPIWFVIGILITFSPELAQALKVSDLVYASKAILFSYLGLSFGSLTSGYLSQALKSRKKSILLFMSLTFIFVAAYLGLRNLSAFYFYTLCAGLGFGTGYWSVFMTTTAEHFGTNLRATATTTVPNFVRGSVVVLTSLFHFFQGKIGLIGSAWVVGLLTLVLALISLLKGEETYGRDLKYVEY